MKSLQWQSALLRKFLINHQKQLLFQCHVWQIEKKLHQLQGSWESLVQCFLPNTSTGGKEGRFLFVYLFFTPIDRLFFSDTPRWVMVSKYSALHTTDMWARIQKLHFPPVLCPASIMSFKRMRLWAISVKQFEIWSFYLKTPIHTHSPTHTLPLKSGVKPIFSPELIFEVWFFCPYSITNSIEPHT